MAGVDDLANLIEERAPGKSARAIADLSGGATTHTTVAKILNRVPHTPQRRTLQGLATALQLPLATVHEAAGVPLREFKLPSEAQELTEERRAALLHYLDGMLQEQRREASSPQE